MFSKYNTQLPHREFRHTWSWCCVPALGDNRSISGWGAAFCARLGLYEVCLLSAQIYPFPPRYFRITDVRFSREAAVVRSGILAKCISVCTERLLKGRIKVKWNCQTVWEEAAFHTWSLTITESWSSDIFSQDTSCGL